jgi:acyl-CoA synthetase (AMP-forming)/AMP-acid ligase II
MAAPFHHVVYHPMVLGTLASQGTVVIPDRIHPRAVLRAAALHRANALMGTPSFLQQLLLEIDREDARLPDLLTLIYGAAPMPPPTIARLRARLPHARPFNCYGLTETASALSVLRPEEMEGREDTVGRPHSGTEVTVRDGSGGVLPPGARGEICCRGPQVIDAYEGGNAAAFRDGWLRTGDVGFVDADGFIHLLGRNDERLNVAGEKIYAWEIERLLLEHPQVTDASVFAMEDPVRGEAVQALVVAETGLTESALRKWCTGRIPAAFLPRRIAFTGELPRNAGGKLQRDRLVAWVRDGCGGKESS